MFYYCSHLREFWVGAQGTQLRKFAAMKQAQHTIELETRGQGLYEITAPVSEWTAGQGIDTGMLNIFCRHTSASLVIQENADPDVMTDLEAFFKNTVPEDLSLYRHRSEGAEDMPAISKRCSPTCRSLSRWPMRRPCSAPGRAFICLNTVFSHTGAGWSCI
jgi:secondary thiamine-phosphate synthase enzyme